MRVKSLILMSFAATTMAFAQDNLKSGLRLENFDKSVRPGDDFYEFACGGWMKNNPLSDEYSRYGSFDKIAEDNRKQLNDLILEISGKSNEKGSVAYKIATLYNQVMDSTTLNKDGVKPLMADLKQIRAIKKNTEIFPMMVKLSHKGVGGYFYTGIEADMKDSKNNIVGMGQSGLSLGQKDYYVDTDEHTKEIMTAFRKHIVKMFMLVGDNEKTATRKMEDVLRIETRIAKASKSRTELRDPESNYHKTAYSALKNAYKNIDFDFIFKSWKVDTPEFIDLGQPEQMLEVNAILRDEKVEAQKAYLEWHYIDEAANYLTDEIRKVNFEFYGKTLSGRLQQTPRWKRAVSLCSGVLGEAVGQMYVEKYFPASHKERMVNLVKNLQVALGERIKAQDWMSEETKKVALDKLNSFYVKIGYPDKWRDYSHMNITTDKSLWENIMTVSECEAAYAIEKKYNKPVDRDEWFMTPQTVNAYYNPTTNEICFPAGILQYPFFDMEADDAFNYGAIGVVIGHEMTHGFDDQGRQFDKDGNLHEWWAAGDADKFTAHVTPLADFFSNINVLDDLKANGKLTLGENLADHGGLQVAYQAFLNATKDAPLKDKDGFTPAQRFFLAYATVWAGNIREAEIRKRTKSDPHALGRWRVNGTLPHINSWYEAFGVKEGDKLFVPAKERVDIW